MIPCLHLTDDPVRFYISGPSPPLRSLILLVDHSILLPVLHPIDLNLPLLQRSFSLTNQHSLRRCLPKVKSDKVCNHVTCKSKETKVRVHTVKEITSIDLLFNNHYPILVEVKIIRYGLTKGFTNQVKWDGGHDTRGKEL